MSAVNQRDMTLVSEVASQLWRLSQLPSLLRLQIQGLTTNTLLVVVGEQGPCQEPILAHSLVLAAASPALASILATSRDSEITLILDGVEREEIEEVLEDIYMGRDRARNNYLNTTHQHCRPLPLDRHPTCLCLVDMKFSLFNGRAPF